MHPMARARPGLEKAINEILERRGVDGKRLSFRQAERQTGLSPATISELAKGNARTPETIRRFARGLNEDANRLLLLAGFVPEDDSPLRAPEAAPPPASASPASSPPVSSDTQNETQTQELDADERAWLQRLEHALSRLPPGSDRALWKDHLRHTTELLERFAECRDSRDLRV